MWNSAAAVAPRLGFRVRRSLLHYSRSTAERLVILLFLLTSALHSHLAAAMSREPFSLPAAHPPGVQARASVVIENENLTFPVTPVGQTSTICRALCVCSTPSLCTCDLSGNLVLLHPLAPPFSAYNYLLEPYANGVIDCSQGTPVQLPVFVPSGHQVAFTIAFSPTSPGTFTDYLDLSFYNFYLSGSAPVHPTTTTSWYVDASGLKDHTLFAWADHAGQQEGQLNAPFGDASFVVLAFGEPWVSQKTYGVTGFSPNFTFVSVDKIETIAKHFILGYEIATQRGLFLAIGTNNYGPYVTSAHGQAWATMLIDLEKWISKHGFAVYLASANDVELENATSPQPTFSWFQGFVNTVNGSGTGLYNYDFGDASSCPTSQATSTPQQCGLTGWTQKDITDLFALFVPEIYNNSTALEWQQISLYNDLQSGRSESFIEGVLTQQQACVQRPPCTGTDYDAGTAWMQLVAALNGSAITAPGVLALRWSTDLKWNQ